MAAGTCTYSVSTAPPTFTSSACRRTTAAHADEEQEAAAGLVEELAYIEEGGCRSMLVRRKGDDEEEALAAGPVEELAYIEEGGCRSMLVRRKGDEDEEEEGGWWEGVVKREMEGGAEEVWAMVSRFGGMKRWNAKVEVCELEEGEEGQAGCVRFCAGGGRWVREKLLDMQPKQRCFSYSLLDSSYGFQGYTATLAVLSTPAPASASTIVRWTFRMRPVPHTPPPRLLSFLTSIFDSMMSSLDRTLQAS